MAYGGLLFEQRQALHARIVAALEALAGDRVVEQVERLASHALLGKVWDKALVYCRQAGEKALAHSAHRGAVEYFEQALGAIQRLPETRNTREQAIDLRFALRSALRPLGDYARILTALREAEALAEALADARRLGQVFVFLSHAFSLMGAYDQAIAAGQRALALATSGGDGLQQALANLYLARAYQAQSDYRRAIDVLGQTVAAFDGAGGRARFGLIFLPTVLSRTLLAACHAELGMFPEGRAFGEAGLRSAEAMAHPASVMFASWGCGLLALRQGDLPRALPWLARAVHICQDADLPVYFPLMSAALGAAYTLGGRVADAMPLLTQALAQSTGAETVVYQAFCPLSLGELQLLAGQLDEAHALVQRALARARGHQERGDQAYALRLFGEIASRRAPPECESAEAHFHQALALAEELGMRPLQAHCHRSLGTLYAATGQREQARTALSAAVDLYQAMEMAFWLPEAAAALAQVDA